MMFFTVPDGLLLIPALDKLRYSFLHLASSKSSGEEEDSELKYKIESAKKAMEDA